MRHAPKQRGSFAMWTENGNYPRWWTLCGRSANRSLNCVPTLRSATLHDSKAWYRQRKLSSPLEPGGHLHDEPPPTPPLSVITSKSLDSDGGFSSVSQPHAKRGLIMRTTPGLPLHPDTPGLPGVAIKPVSPEDGNTPFTARESKEEAAAAHKKQSLEMRVIELQVGCFATFFSCVCRCVTVTVTRSVSLRRWKETLLCCGHRIDSCRRYKQRMSAKLSHIVSVRWPSHLTSPTRTWRLGDCVLHSTALKWTNGR
jgi:hypothetical protein